MIIPSRRGFIAGLASALTAPAIVHAGNLMPIKRIDILGPLKIDLPKLETILQNLIFKIEYAIVDDVGVIRIIPGEDATLWLKASDGSALSDSYGGISNGQVI